MQAMKKINKYINHIAFTVSIIGFLAVVGMMLLITVDVFLRKFFNNPILGSYEIVQYMLMAMVFSSFAYTQAKKGHIRMTMLINYLPWHLRAAISALTELIGAGGILVLAYAAMLQAQYSHARGLVSDVLKFSITPFFWLQAVTMLIFALVLLFDFASYIVAIFDREYAEELFKDYV